MSAVEGRWTTVDYEMLGMTHLQLADQSDGCSSPISQYAGLLHPDASLSVSQTRTCHQTRCRDRGSVPAYGTPVDVALVILRESQRSGAASRSALDAARIS